MPERKWTQDDIDADLLGRDEPIAHSLTVPALEQGDTPRKLAAYRAFYDTVGNDLPKNANGDHPGSFWVGVMTAIKTYLEFKD